MPLDKRKGSYSSAAQSFLGIACVLALVATAALASDSLETRVPLANFRFDGLTLPTSIDDLRQQYPSAVSDAIGLDEKIGLTCFVVKRVPAADSATFCFYDGELYQAEFSYAPDRIRAQGGMAAVLRRLVTNFGPPDHVDQVRRTWRLNAAQRADFYARPTGSTLVVTDINLLSSIERRQTNEQLTSSVELGF
jgi:hypothetical protein